MMMSDARTVMVWSAASRHIQMNALPPLTLYVHIPWCVKKCPYCDFNSHEWKNTADWPEKEYLDALRRDLELALPSIWGRRIQSVFIGGGTPSLLSAAGIDRLLSNMRACLPLNPDAEITLEANPGTFEADKFKQFRASGVNRLSIGIQSFNDAHLNALGRIHNTQPARRAVEIARDAFDHFNLDLMFALPGQTFDECRADIETALSYAPPHLSIYQLTLEANTYFSKYPPRLPDDEQCADMQDWIHARLHDARYAHYEVSAYAQPHQRCQHNLNYWQFGDYLGIGAGAHSKLSFPQRIVRQVRYKQPTAYLRQCAENAPIQQEYEVSAEDVPFEFMLNALRLTEGFPIHQFTERTGLPLRAIEMPLRAAITRGLLIRDHQTIVPTPLGRRFLSDLQALFLKTSSPPFCK